MYLHQDSLKGNVYIISVWGKGKALGMTGRSSVSLIKHMVARNRLLSVTSQIGRFSIGSLELSLEKLLDKSPLLF